MNEANQTALTFAEARQALEALLKSQGWPTQVAFLPASHALWVSRSLMAVLRPSPATSQAALTEFDSARVSGVPVEVCAIGVKDTRVFATVRVIHELAQGEGMFISRGTKVSCSVPQFKIAVVRSRLYWGFLTWSVNRRQRRALERLKRAA